MFLYILENQNKSDESVERLTARRYVIGIGLVLVAIMMVINIINIHSYLKRNSKDEETMYAAN